MADAGRPSLYEPGFCQIAKDLCENGATDDDLLDYFGVSMRTLYRWRNLYPEFRQAIQMGKEVGDDRIVRTLYQRAAGYRWVEQQPVKLKRSIFDASGKKVAEEEYIEMVEVEKSVPPDTAAIQFWLKNRQGQDWRDKTEVQHKFDTETMSDDELSRIAAGSGERVATSPGGSSKPH